jgi:hypothetical protein
MLFAPKDTITSIRKSAQSSSSRATLSADSSLFSRLRDLVQSMMKKDNHFVLLDSICTQLQRTAVLFSQQLAPTKYAGLAPRFNAK